MEPIRLWANIDDTQFSAVAGPKFQEPYAALPSAEFDALAADAADARTLRAERDSLVKERDAATARADKAEALLRDIAAELREDGYVVIPDRIDAHLERKA